MATEKITDARRMAHWPGHMETDYVYTLGLAGERFFKEIKENGRILGASCKRCSNVFVPPRLYCEKCFEKLTEWVDVGKKAFVHTFTIAHIDTEGNKLEDPTIYALMKFPGVEGGLIHKLGEIHPHEARIGLPVEAVLKPPTERKGTIGDIKYFKPEK